MLLPKTSFYGFLILVFLLSNFAMAKPSAMEFKKWRCQYQCMTDFDMCVTQVKSLEEYVICHSAQGICKYHCSKNTEIPKNSFKAVDLKKAILTKNAFTSKTPTKRTIPTSKNRR